jgi:hypothetical protein
MRSLMPYILAGIVVVVAMDVVAPPVGLGFAGVAQSATGMSQPAQIVDRTRKGDRLQLPRVREGQRPTGVPPMPIGCEAAFSSLSAGARANFPGRCLAERITSVFVVG